MHPLAPLELGPGDPPADLSLESQDCLSLYQALVAHDTKDRLADLAPNKFFRTHGNSLLRQKEVIEYETTLKRTVQSLSHSSDPEDRRLVKKVLDSLSSGFFDIGKRINPRAEFFINKEDLGSELASLLNVLKEQQDLVSAHCFRAVESFLITERMIMLARPSFYVLAEQDGSICPTFAQVFGICRRNLSTNQPKMEEESSRMGSLA